MQCRTTSRLSSAELIIFFYHPKPTLPVKSKQYVTASLQPRTALKLPGLLSGSIPNERPASSPASPAGGSPLALCECTHEDGGRGNPDCQPRDFGLGEPGVQGQSSAALRAAAGRREVHRFRESGVGSSWFASSGSLSLLFLPLFHSFNVKNSLPKGKRGKLPLHTLHC